LLAIVPTVTISIISGTTSSIDSYFSNIYSRDTLSGKYIVINEQLIRDLYKTTYEIHPRRQIDLAAVFQESIDQAVSKSIYTDEKLRPEMEDIYLISQKDERNNPSLRIRSMA